MFDIFWIITYCCSNLFFRGRIEDNYPLLVSLYIILGWGRKGGGEGQRLNIMILYSIVMRVFSLVLCDLKRTCTL